MGARKGQPEEDYDMANRVRGDERRGEDGDEGQGSNVRVVQIENAYHEKLRERLGAGVKPEPVTDTPATAEPERQPAGPVIYNDDGTVYKRPD